jgi:hypothetical protein
LVDPAAWSSATWPVKVLFAGAHTGVSEVHAVALFCSTTLYTTPVVYLYLDRLQNWLRGDRRQRDAATELRDVAAAE